MKFVLIADKVGSRISYRIVIPRSEVRCLLEAVDHYSRAVTPRSKRKETCSYAELIIIERGVGVLNRHFSKYGLWCTAEKYPIEWLRRAPTPVSWGSEIDESLANTQGWIDASDKSEEVLMVCCNPHWRGDFHGRKATKLVAQLRKIEAAVEAVNRSSYFWLSVAWLAQNLTRRPRKGRARPTKKTRPAKMVRTILDFM